MGRSGEAFRGFHFQTTSTPRVTLRGAVPRATTRPATHDNVAKVRKAMMLVMATMMVMARVMVMVMDGHGVCI
jgi:hypothetical protein